MSAADIINSLNDTEINWAVLPFQNFTEEENNDRLASHKQNINNYANYPHTLNMELLDQLPFNQCSDFEIIATCMSNIENFLRLLENNNLSNQTIKQVSNLQHNFNCSYRNEMSFKKIIKKSCIKFPQSFPS